MCVCCFEANWKSTYAPSLLDRWPTAGGYSYNFLSECLVYFLLRSVEKMKTVVMWDFASRSLVDTDLTFQRSVSPR